MTPLLFVLAAASGAVGRHLAGRFVCSWQALLTVNTLGAALLGWIAARDVGDATLTIVGVGFCGSLTTFSTFALEVRTLGPRFGAIFAMGSIACVTGAASLAATL
jgi:fluoride exporter